MSGKNIDDDIAWWKAQSERQGHPELQMVCWGIATGLKLAKEDFEAGLPQPKFRKLRAASIMEEKT